jgi:adenylate cyclase
MLSPQNKRTIARVAPYGVIWLFFSFIYTFLERGLLGPLDYYPGTGNPYNFRNAISITPVAALITGLCLGTLEILYISNWFQQTSFGRRILYKSAIYLVFISLFLVLLVAVAEFLGSGTGFFSEKVWKMVTAFLFTYAFLSIVLFIGSILVVTQFFVEVSEKVSLGVLQNFFTGKYHKPVEEERIFMFLDMKSSTTIAERMGHIRYFEMLRDYYSDLSVPILNHSGEIYQYVGDEVVVTWNLENGLRYNNCVQCFFDMKAIIQLRASRYTEKYGQVPEFKAGFHFGKVTTGEIGVIKKEIIFTGDVLNTTARIQELCNAFKVDILVSQNLIKKLNLDSKYQIKPLQEYQLRGRDEKIELCTILQLAR